MVFSEESTVGAFLLRARREGLRDFGACMSPHTAWLILQGIETLPLRMARHVDNTRKVVEFLAAHPMVARVGYPELDGHPSHALARAAAARLRRGVQLRPEGQPRRRAQAFIEALKIFSHLANVGDCRSLVIHPASTTHFRMDDAALAAAGIGAGHHPAVDRAGGCRRPDRRPEARAEGGGEGRMKLDVDGRTAYAYTGGKPFDPALPCVVFVHGALHDHSVWTCWRAGARTTATACWRSTCPATAAAKARRWPTSRRWPTGCWRCWTPRRRARARWSGHSMGSLIALEAAAARRARRASW
jgi:hypothetical protein